MTGLVLANIDLRKHVTDEGEQLQAGLEQAGWTLAGFGYGDGCVDVPTLLDRHKPRIVLIAAREDWDERSPGCFDRRCSFRRIHVLASRPDIFKVQVVKDCPGPVDRRKRWCEEIKASAVLLYYHPDSMLAVSPWLRDYPLIRTWHTVDGELCRKIIETSGVRALGAVSGARSPVYPLRSMAADNAAWLGLDVLQHPGYRVRRSHSAEYLKTLAQYKVHVATCSVYGFALRKIVESVAVGCVPLTNLPSFDVLPEIDGSLVRVASDIHAGSLRQSIHQQAAEYNTETRLEWARRCWEFYDWRVRGKALSQELTRIGEVNGY